MASSNTQDQEQAYFPPMPDYRRRSSSKTDRYRPASYSNPPPYQPDPTLLGPHQYPVSPALTPPQQQQQQQPPYPVDYPMASPYMEVPNMAQHQLGGGLGQRRPSATMYPDGLTRPSYDGSQLRRPSYESRISHRSERSHRTHHSNNSHHSRRSHYQEEDDDDEDDSRRRHKRRSHHKEKDDDLDAYRQRVRDRGDNVSRSWGNSLVSIFGPLKYLFEPRDKY